MSNRKIQWSIVLFALVLFTAGAEEAVDQKASAQTNDLLNITVTGLMTPNTKIPFRKRVDADGKITMPLVGKIDVKGKTLDEIQKSVDAAYADAQLIRNAATEVTREEIASKPSIKSAPIAKGDHLEFRIWDLDGPQQEHAEVLEVDENGEVALPIAGKLKLGGKSEADAEAAIEKLYRDKELIFKAALHVRRLSDEEAKEHGAK